MPYKSKSQMRAFFAKEKRGELKPGTARKWAHETKNIKRLPEKIKSGNGASGRTGKFTHGKPRKASR
jgi:hypothetical protein